MGLISKLRGLFQRPPILQVAMLCTRSGPEGLEILLVKSLDTGRWIIPKGWPEDGMSLLEAAEREAWEEAGARGTLHPREVARYPTFKRRGELNVPTEMIVFRMDDTVLVDDYPEQGMRERRFLPKAAAAARADVAELSDLIRRLPS